MKPEELKGHLDGLILAVVAREPLHGYAVIEQLKARSGGALALPRARCTRPCTGSRPTACSRASGRRRPAAGGVSTASPGAGKRSSARSRERWRVFSGTIEAVLA